jgi:signal transduction histidine kinase
MVRNAEGKGLPRTLIYGFCLLSLAPSLLHFAGIDFGAAVEAPASSTSRALHEALRGSLVHVLLEWSAVAVAIFTVLLAAAYIRHKRDDVTLIIALALFVSGCVDAFHALAATYLVSGVADSTNFIPFTWAISRVFHAIVLLVGVGWLLGLGAQRGSSRNVMLLGGIFAMGAYWVVHVCASSDRLPQTMFPDAFITRPWDVAPLLLFVVAGVFLYPALHRRYRSSFTQALWLSVVPDIVTEAHMAFGSSSLFDSHFQIAHLTKVIAYAVPLSGLVLDYARAYRNLETTNERLESAATELNLRAAELERANADLKQFAYIASHDLRAPLRAIDNLATWLSEDLGDSLEGESREHLALMRGRVKRMDELLNALLNYSRIGRSAVEPTEVRMSALIREIEEMYVGDSGLELRTTSELPTLTTDVVGLRQVLANLISNAVKHRDEASTRIEVSCVDEGDWYEFTVRDDGPGIAPQYHDRVFEMSQTLKPRDEVEGSGMGLALVERQVLSNGGRVLLSSGDGRGATFRFTWSKQWTSRS